MFEQIEMSLPNALILNIFIVKKPYSFFPLEKTVKPEEFIVLRSL